MKADHRKMEEIIPKRFYKWLKMFEKVESEKIPVRKA